MKNLIIFLALILGAVQAEARCVNGRHVPMTQGSKAECAEIQQLASQKREIQREKTRRSIEAQKAELNGNISGKQNANKGTIVNVGAAGGMSASDQAKIDAAAANGEFPKTRWSLGLEWHGYFFPDTYGACDRCMAKNPMMINGASATYWVSQNLGFGMMMQNYELQGRTFDEFVLKEGEYETITVSDAEGNTYDEERTVTEPVTVTPGMDSIHIQRLMYYATLTAPLTEDRAWLWSAKVGSGYAMGKIRYSDENLADYDISAARPWLFDVNILYQGSGSRLGGGMRVVTADNDKTNYLDYNKIGGTDFYLTWEFDLAMFGYL